MPGVAERGGREGRARRPSHLPRRRHDDRHRGGGLHGELRGVVKDAAGPLRDVAWEALEATDSDYGEKGQPDPSFAWCDLRATEAYRLMSLMDEAIERAASRCEAIILEELTAAGVTFAAEHPDAPRPSTKPLVSAGA